VSVCHPLLFITLHSILWKATNCSSYLVLRNVTLVFASFLSLSLEIIIWTKFHHALVSLLVLQASYQQQCKLEGRCLSKYLSVSVSYLQRYFSWSDKSAELRRPYIEAEGGIKDHFVCVCSVNTYSTGNVATYIYTVVIMTFIYAMNVNVRYSRNGQSMKLWNYSRVKLETSANYIITPSYTQSRLGRWLGFGREWLMFCYTLHPVVLVVRSLLRFDVVCSKLKDCM